MLGKKRYRDADRWTLVLVLVGFRFLCLFFQLGPQSLEQRFPNLEHIFCF